MISTITIIILAVMAGLALWVLPIGLRPMWVTGRSQERDAFPRQTVSSACPDKAGSTESDEDDSDEPQPAEASARKRSLTVVVFASCNEDVLGRWIERVLEQDYPDFDVVVVYDANAENTASLAERYADEKRLYFTFIPPGSHTLNRRKLALTIGIKAAKSDYVLTTIPQVEIPSDRWLSEMMDPVNSSDGSQEVILGFSHFNFREFGAMKRVRARIETITEGARWIGDALRNHPWRGDGNNLIFKRSLFFENKGFADGLLLEGGDDDIFVGRIARPDNTTAIVTPETVLTVDWGAATGQVWQLSRKRYRSTYDLLPKRPRIQRYLCRLFSWIIIPLGLFAAWTSGFGWLADTLSGLILVIFFGCEAIAYRRASHRLIPES